MRVAAILTSLLMLALLFCGQAYAQDVPVVQKHAVEVFGDNHGGEARFMFLGPAGGAVGFYGGYATDQIRVEQDVVRFGGVARYNIATSGPLPAGDWLPQFLGWFKNSLGLPATTPADAYVGVAVGGLYAFGSDDDDLSFEVRPLIGLRVGFIGGEFGRGLGDVIGEADTPSAWTWKLGLYLPF